MPIGTEINSIKRETTVVIALTTAGSTWLFGNGASKKFSTIMPFTPPETSATASCSARSIIALRLPPQRAEVGRGNK